jgi:hypothetical protein
MFYRMTAEPNHWADGIIERDVELMLSLAWRSCHVEKLSEAIHKNRIDD